jgi:hypothetical protein
MKIELYINNQLCDIDNPSSFGVYLKKQFINPAELNTKDAQKSYSISLPATPNNNEIFSYVNVEEVQGKFNIYPNAKLYVRGVLILDGKFRISEITKQYYKGNLGIPAPIAISDIFGDNTMNQAGKWPCDFKGVTDITKYNEMVNAPCIFPFVLYSLLQKRDTNGNFSAKNVYDNTVLFGLGDFPPSVNVIQMLQKIFENAGYILRGSAITDKRINGLYVSYKNPESYQLLWGVGKMMVSGVWGNYQNGETENNYATNEVNGYNIVAANLFNSTTADLSIEDTGANAVKTISGDTQTITFKIPQSGLYKLEFDASIKLRDETLYNPSGLGIITGDLNNGVNSEFELKVVRYSDRQKFFNEDYDNSFYKNNQNQEPNVDGSIFPQSGAVNFIDPLQNSDFICGFSFGRGIFYPFFNPASPDKNDNPMAISGGRSWSFNNSENGTQFRALSAVNSPGYVTKAGSIYNPADKFIVNLENAPIYTNQTDSKNAEGKITQVIWLEKGEQIDVVSVSPYSYSIPAWTNHEIDFTLSLEPFRPYKSWIKVNNSGDGTEYMDYNDPSSYDQGAIDLIKFLPSGVKINDWINNFCKAFNLRLENKGPKSFELNIKGNDIAKRPSYLVDLDNLANVDQRANQSLGLPYIYKLGFTLDTGEEGYYQTMENEIDADTGEPTGNKILDSGSGGGGNYYTGSNETNIISQTSNFSYCWYKQLLDTSGNPLVKVPVITNHDVWENDYDYEETRDSYFLDSSQRFWYRLGLFDAKINDQTDVKLAIVSNEYNGSKRLILDYKNKQDSIMKSFFLLLVSNNNDYTIVDCYLSPEEYANLKYSLVKFNGDIYNVAEIDGYDPLARRKGTIKLIRRIL